MTGSPLVEAADLVLAAYPPGCALRDEAERFALELLAADPGKPAMYERRRRAALAGLSGEAGEVVLRPFRELRGVS
jgi:hypothetical protein